jgi:hypothetical protein
VRHDANPSGTKTVGREQELAVASEFVHALRDGPRALLVEGEAGIGKTTVWRAALAEAEAAPALEPGAPLPVPQSLRELVDDRISRLAPHARAALLAAAALSHPTVGLVERAASVGGLVAAEESGLLGSVGDHVAFAHPLYASAVYASAASGRRRALHRRLAELVADPEERVRHRALAASRPDDSVATGLEDAAATARGRGAWETAGELLEHARALTPPTRQEAARKRGVLAAEHHIYAGDRPRARGLLEAIVADAPPGSVRSDALRLLAETRFNSEGFAEAAPLLEEALEHADDPALAVAIELDLTYVLCNHHGDVPAAAAYAKSAIAHAERAPDRTQLGEALAVGAMVDFLLGRGVDWSTLERALALEAARSGPCRPSPLHFRPSAITACLKLWVGKHEEAREDLTALRLAATDAGDESDLAYYLTWLAWLETMSGNLAAAASFAEEAATDAALAGSEFNRAWALAQLAQVHAHRGDATRARAEAAAASEICARFEASNPLPWVAGALGLLELSLGDAAAAWAAVAPLTEALEANAIAEPLAAFVPHAVEALTALVSSIAQRSCSTVSSAPRGSSIARGRA